MQRRAQAARVWAREGGSPVRRGGGKSSRAWACTAKRWRGAPKAKHGDRPIAEKYREGKEKRRAGAE